MATKKVANKKKAVEPCKKTAPKHEPRMLVEGDVGSNEVRTRLRTLKKKYPGTLCVWLESDGKTVIPMVQFKAKCMRCKEESGVILPVFADFRIVCKFVCSKCKGTSDPHAGMRKDMLTGEWFKPVHGGQQFATAANREKFHKKAYMAGLQALKAEAAGMFAKGVGDDNWPKKEK